MMSDDLHYELINVHIHALHSFVYDMFYAMHESLGN